LLGAEFILEKYSPTVEVPTPICAKKPPICEWFLNNQAAFRASLAARGWKVNLFDIELQFHRHRTYRNVQNSAIRPAKGSRSKSFDGPEAPLVVFFFGVFWKRLNAAGCLWAMVVGFAVGVFRMLVDKPTTLDPNFQFAKGSLQSGQSRHFDFGL